MGGIKKKLQRLFGGGNRKRERRDGNLSDFAPQNEGLGGSGVTGLGMTQSGTDLGDWGNGAILDELQPPPVSERKDRPELTTARLDNPTGLNGRPFLTTGRRDNPILGGHRTTPEPTTGISDDESSLESSGSSEVELLESSESSSSQESSSSSSLPFQDGDDIILNSQEDDEGDDLQSLPTLGLVSQGSNIPAPPPLPPQERKYENVAPLGKDYKGEDVEGTWRDKKFPGSGKSRTEYIRDESERQKRRLEVDDQGRLVKNGQLLTTGKLDKEGKRTGGEDLFAMNPMGDLLSSNDVEEHERLKGEVLPILEEGSQKTHGKPWNQLSPEERVALMDSLGVKAPYWHHSSYHAGEDLGGVGTIRSNEGLIKQIAPDSGHHKPKTEHTMNTLTELKERGANLDHARVGVHERDDDGDLIFDDPDDPRHAQMEFFHPNEMFESEGNEETLMGKKGFLHEIEKISKKSKLDKKDDLPQLDEMLHRARGKVDFQEPKRGPAPEKGPEEFTGRSWGKAGPKLDGPKKYEKTARLQQNYEGEHDFAQWRTVGKRPSEYESRNRTAGLTEAGRDKRRLHVGEDGLLYNTEGLLLDTIDSGGLIREDMDEGAFLFAMDQSGDILTSDAYQENIDLEKRRQEAIREGRPVEERDKQYFHHSSFFGGRDVAGAGGLRVRDGKAVTLTPNSGHYHGTNEHTLNVFDELNERGVDMTDLKIDFITQHEGGEDDRKLGKKRMQYLSAGAVQAALGTDEDEQRAKSEGKRGPSREKALARLDQQVELLDEIKRVRYLAGSNDDTRSLEKKMVELMLDGAQEKEVTEYVEKQGFDVIKIDPSVPYIEITDPNVSPLKIKEVSRPENRARYEEMQAKHDSEKSTRLDEHEQAQKDGSWYRDVGRLPEWARTKQHEQMAIDDEKFKALDQEQRAKKRAKELQKQREQEEREKQKSTSNPYGFNNPYGYSNPYDNSRKEEVVQEVTFNVDNDEDDDQQVVFDEDKGEIVEVDDKKDEELVGRNFQEDEDKDEDSDSSSSDDGAWERQRDPNKPRIVGKYNYN